MRLLQSLFVSPLGLDLGFSVSNDQSGCVGQARRENSLQRAFGVTGVKEVLTRKPTVWPAEIPGPNRHGRVSASSCMEDCIAGALLEHCAPRLTGKGKHACHFQQPLLLSTAVTVIPVMRYQRIIDCFTYFLSVFWNFNCVYICWKEKVDIIFHLPLLITALVLHVFKAIMTLVLFIMVEIL